MAVAKPRVALVCDWLTNVGGAEKVLLAIHEMFPDAPIYTSQYDAKGINWFSQADVKTGWMQKLPSKSRRFFAPLRSNFFRNLDLSDYDLVISVTGAEAKGVKTGSAKHICYCHVPTQYYWQMYEEYIKNPGFGALDPVARAGLKTLVKPLRRRDLKFAKQPDQFVTISKYAAGEIKKYYHRSSIIVAPPVDVEVFHNKSTSKRSGFVVVARQVTWKRLDLAIKACLETGQELTLIGDGPEHANLVKLAQGSPLIKFVSVSGQPEVIKKYLTKAAGFIFPSLEPFGIAPIEALAAGCPVIAYNKGGSRDYVVDGKNGITFDQQSVSSLVTALRKFEKTKFTPTTVAKTADYYSKDRFKKEMQEVIDAQLAQ